MPEAVGRVDVVGIGAVTWDRFLVVPRYPGPNDKVRAIHSEECGGGMAATAVVALSRWGMKCRLIGMLGEDNYSDLIVNDLKQEGVLTDCIVRRIDADGRRSTILVDNRNGNRSIISGPHRVPPIQPEDLSPRMFEGARVLHLDTTVDECGLEAAQMAKRLGLWVTLDAETLQPRTQELMRHCDTIIAPLSFAIECTGETKSDLAAYGLHLQTGKPVIVTNGPQGCDFCSEEFTFHQAAYDAPVVDSTGAGDIFHAAYIYGTQAGWGVRKTVRFASWASACACREIGGRRSIPTLDAVHHFSHHDREEHG